MIMAMASINLNPSRKELSQFGAIAFVLLGLLGSLAFWRQHLLGLGLGNASVPVAAVLWSIGLASGLSSLIWPKANRPLWIVLICLTYPIGLVVSFVLMALVFYGLFTPVGIVFRLIGRDPLCRRFEKELDTYWQPHQPPADIKRYFRQF